MRSFPRAERVAGHVQKELAAILVKQINDPRLQTATITEVRMTSDLKLARVYYCVSGDESSRREASRALAKALGFMKRELARNLRLRYMPDLVFFYDESLERGIRVDAILKDVATTGMDRQSVE